MVCFRYIIHYTLIIVIGSFVYVILFIYYLNTLIFVIGSFVYVILLIYYLNSRILCVCPCVCVSVISNYSGTEGRSTMPFSQTWRASSGELEQLLFQSTRRVVQEEKPLEPFHW